MGFKIGRDPSGKAVLYCPHGYRGNPETCVDCNAVALPGMAEHIEAQDQAAAEYSGQELTAKLCEPGKDISTQAGEMERKAPLFFGTGDNPTLF